MSSRTIQIFRVCEVKAAIGADRFTSSPPAVFVMAVEAQTNDRLSFRSNEQFMVGDTLEVTVKNLDATS